MKRDASGEAIAAVRNYVRYLQRLGVTELPVTLAPAVRTEAAVRGITDLLHDQDLAVDRSHLRVVERGIDVRDNRLCHRRPSP